MKDKLILLSLVVLSCLAVLNFSVTSQSLSKNEELQTIIKENPNKIVYVQAKDGKTPVKGVDYFDGANGLNAVSFSITNNIVKEVPLIGEKGADGVNGKDGANGKDGQTQQIRINPDTGDLENKYSDWWVWNILIPCSELKTSCPGQ